jgi:hypothetical protein
LAEEALTAAARQTDVHGDRAMHVLVKAREWHHLPLAGAAHIIENVSEPPIEDNWPYLWIHLR